MQHTQGRGVGGVKHESNVVTLGIVEIEAAAGYRTLITIINPLTEMGVG